MESAPEILLAVGLIPTALANFISLAILVKRARRG